MGITDFNFKGIESLKAKFENLNIGLNKEETKFLIDLLDQSTHFHYHAETGLPPETILKLPTEDVGQFVKHQAYLTLKAAYQNKPDQLAKLIGTYTASAITAGTAIMAVNASIPYLIAEPASLASSSSSSSSSAIPSIPPIPSGDFVKELPKIIGTNIKITPPDGPITLKVQPLSPKITTSSEEKGRENVY